MLVLNRRQGERIIISGGIEVVVLGTQGNRVRLGIVAPPEVCILRQELAERMDRPEPHEPPQRILSDALSNSALCQVRCEDDAGALI